MLRMPSIRLELAFPSCPWVRAYIEENRFSSNSKIPSENALCRRLSVSRETVRRALDRDAADALHQAGVGVSVLPLEDQADLDPVPANLDCYQRIYQKRIPVIFYNNYYKSLKCPRVVVNDPRCAEDPAPGGSGRS